MAKSDIGPRIGIDGEKEFRAQIAQINSAVRTLGAEMKVVTTAFAGQENQEKKLTAQNDVLSRTVLTLKDKLKEQEAMLEQSIAKYGEADKRTLEWRRAVLETTAEINKNENAIKENERALENLNNETEKGARLSEGFGRVLKGVGVAAAAATAAVAAAAVKLGKEVVKAFGDLEQNIGGSEAVFGEYAQEIQKISENAFKQMGVSQSEYLSTANKIAALFQGSGLEIDRSLELTTKAMQRAADMASVMGIDTESALEAITGASKGNYTMMDNLGVAMNATTLQAYAMSKGIDKAWASMTNAEKAELSMQYFFENTEQYAGNFARESEQTITGSIGMLKAAAKSFVAGLGNTNADVKNLASNMISAFTTVIKNVAPILENLGKAVPEAITEIIGAIVPQLPSFVQTGSDIFFSLLIGLTSMLPDIFEAGVSAIGTLVQGLSDAAPQIVMAAVESIGEFVDTLTSEESLDAIIGGALEMVENLAAGLIDAIPQLIEAAMKLVTNLITYILNPENQAQMLKTGLNIVVSIVTGIINAIPVLIKGVAQLITNMWAQFKNTDWAEIGRNIVEGVLNGLKRAWQKLTSWFSEAWNGIVSSVKNFLGIASPSKVFAQIGGYMAEGVGVGFTRQMVGVERDMQASIPTQLTMADVLAGTVNGMQTAMAGVGGTYSVEIPLYINGQEFYRASIGDLRSVMRSNPEVSYA